MATASEGFGQPVDISVPPGLVSSGRALLPQFAAPCCRRSWNFSFFFVTPQGREGRPECSAVPSTNSAGRFDSVITMLNI